MADSGGAGALPPGWAPHTSRRTGKTYFFHAATGKALWSVAEVHAVHASTAGRASAGAHAARAASAARQSHTSVPRTSTSVRSGGSTGVGKGGARGPGSAAPATVARPRAVVQPAKVARLTPQQVEEEARASREKLQEHMDKMMEDLMADDSRTCTRVPAPDSMTEYIVVDAAETVGLLAQCFGKGEERIVVAYKEGTVPEELAEKEEHEKLMEAKKEEHFNAMVHEARTTTRKAPHDVHVAGKVQRQRVQPKKRDRRTIEEVQAAMRAELDPSGAQSSHGGLASAANSRNGGGDPVATPGSGRRSRERGCETS